MLGFSRNNRLVVSKTLTKMLISFFIIVILSTSLIAGVLYQKFSKATVEGIRTNIEENLAQNMNQLELIRDQVYSIGLQLISDSDIVDSMYRNGATDELIKYKATRKLYQVKSSNPMIHSIYVYNSETKQFTSSLGSSGLNSLDAEMKKMTVNYKEGNKLKFIPLSYVNKSPNGNETNEKIITFIFVDSSQDYIKSDIKGNGLLDSVVIINLNADYIQKAFTQQYTSPNSSIFLLDKSGEVICDSDYKYFSKNISDRQFIKKVLESDKKSGYMISEDEGKKYLMTYNMSSKIPFLFVSKYDYQILLQEVQSLKDSIILICVLIGIICIIVAGLAAYNVYLPFGRLVRTVEWHLKSEYKENRKRRTYNEVEYLSNAFTNIIKKSNELENSIQQNIPMLRKMFLTEMLSGHFSSSDVSTKVKELGINIVQEKTCVVVISIDGYLTLKGIENKIEIADKKNVADKIIRDSINEFSGMELVDLEEDMFAIILNIRHTGEYDELLDTRIKTCQKQIGDELDITFSAAKGMLVSILEDISLSYANALNLLKYRFIYGYNCILDNKLVKPGLKDNSVVLDKTRKKIIQSIKVCDEKQVNLGLEELVRLICDCQYDFIRLTINQLVLDIMTAVGGILNPAEEELDFNNIYSNLNKSDTLEAAKEWLESYCCGIIHRLEQKKDNRQKDMIEKVLAYIRTNYLRTDISSEMLSDMVSLTPGYFGKIFSDFVGKSVNEYIIELRMNKAKELLEKNNLSVNDIAAQVGFSNQSYFTATFRKWNGLTPNQYRCQFKKPL